MPCYQQVKIETNIRLTDRAVLDEIARSLDAVVNGNAIRKDHLTYYIEENASVTATVAAFDQEEAETFLKQLKREYTLASLSTWAKSHRFNVRRNGNKLQARRWV